MTRDCGKELFQNWKYLGEDGFMCYIGHMTYMKRVEWYAEQTGISVEAIIVQALEDWFKTVGDARLETPPCNLIQFPVIGKLA